MLSKKNKLPHDNEIVLHERLHQYFNHDTKKVCCTSVTSLVYSCFERFDAHAVVTKYIDKWKVDATSKYYKIVHDTKDDMDASRNIQFMWKEKGANPLIFVVFLLLLLKFVPLLVSGREASRLGTSLHKKIEQILNGDESPLRFEHEDQLSELLRCRRFLDLYELEPVRTELITFFTNSDSKNTILAGSVDLLAKDKNGHYVLVDWKLSSKDLREVKTTTTFCICVCV